MAENEPAERHSEHWSEGEDESNDTSNPSVNSEELRNRIALTNAQLHELSKDDAKFFEAVRHNNDKAVECITAGNSKEGLAYLTEAERYLEYGACCGKVIDRNLIICVLHNEAAAYQRIWAIEKCSKYIEATIYNIETSLDKDADVYSRVTFTEPSLKGKQLQLVCSVIKRKQTLVQYHLQYCALMSQLKNHVLALSSSFKAMALMKELFGTYYKYFKSYATEERNNLTVYGKKLKLFKELASYRQDIQLPSYASILKRVRWVLKEWRVNKNSSNDNEEVQNWVKTYSIGNAMQMEAYVYTEAEAHINFKKEFELESIIRKVLLFAISYFTVATEIRLNEVDKFQNNEQEKRRSEDFQRSELYHLTSIKIFASFVPYESMFIKHVLHSYSNHYKPELTTDEVSFIADDQLDDGQMQTAAAAVAAGQSMLNSQQSYKPQESPVSEQVVQHAMPINIPQPPPFKPISVHHHRHPEPQTQPTPQQPTPQHPHPLQQPQLYVTAPLSHQSSSHSNHSHPIQDNLSSPIDTHTDNNQQYDQEEEQQHIRSLNNQPVKRSKKKLIQPLNLLKVEHQITDEGRKNSHRPMSTKSNTKATGRKILSPRVGKPTKNTDVRGQYYCGERSATKRKKNPEKKQRPSGDRTSRSVRPKLVTEVEPIRPIPRGKSRGKEVPRSKVGSKSQKPLKRKEIHQPEFEPLVEDGYFIRKPNKPKNSIKPKNIASSKKRL